MGATSVSPVIRRTCDSSTPNHSTMSWAKLGYALMALRDAARTVISARSRGAPVFSSR